MVSLYRRKKIMDPEGRRAVPRDRQKEGNVTVMAWQWAVLQHTDTLKRESLLHLGQVWHALGDSWKADRDEMLGCSRIDTLMAGSRYHPTWYMYQMEHPG